jgi:transcriptional regulator with XRE-family HTH domain
MARAALGWGVRELAAAAKVSVDTLARFERGGVLKERTVEAIQRALEEAGIDFIPENGGSVGVRFREPVTAPAQPTSTARPTKAKRQPCPRRRGSGACRRKNAHQLFASSRTSTCYFPMHCAPLGKEDDKMAVGRWAPPQRRHQYSR